ncbi:MAG: ATP-binding protein [Deltaproteobacteria bacterium]|nr:ATP-binding protein [Deltaproteobacteria bacterium]
MANDEIELKQSFSATLENVDRAAEKIQQFLIKTGIKDRSFNIILGMREALINAVTHGNGSDSKKKVTFRLQMEGHNLIMEVEDEGRGFDWNACLMKPLPSREESGRGLAIMKRTFTSIEFNEKGNRLILEKMI